MIFSDSGETIENVTIYDALDEVDMGIRLHHPDYDLWRRLKGVRDKLTAKDHSLTSGWKIDKYKNLPMAEKAFCQYPSLKWYIFTDPDTFVSPTNLMTWLQKLDHTRPLYLENPSRIGTQTFAHGGSGHILSQPAIKAVTRAYSHERGYWDDYAA